MLRQLPRLCRATPLGAPRLLAATLRRTQLPAPIIVTPSVLYARRHAAFAASAAASSTLAGLAVNAMENGILGADDYYRHGLPKSQFSLTNEKRSLEQQDDGDVLFSIFQQHKHVDPYDLVKHELRTLSATIKDVVGSDHPILERIARYFFDVKGKRFRPAVVLLMAQATAPHPLASLSSPSSPSSLSSPSASLDILPSQRRLSEITEMIHTASLLHDDVIDEADTRRGAPSINSMFGNKLAILGGDFLLARASVALARLRNPDVIELLSQVIEHLVKGEVMQMRASDRKDLLSNVDYYLTKSYYKTASLIANSCKAVVALGGHPPSHQDIAFEYGKHIGLAFQIVDDLLDFVGNDKVLGKPAHNDLAQGIATLPVLFAAEEFPELKDMIVRKFSHEGDVARASRLVENSRALERARHLAVSCSANAVAAVRQLPPSPAQSALIALVEKVLVRDS